MSGPCAEEWLADERRLRIVFGGQVVADTRRPRLLRQHGFLPVWYVPEADVRRDLLEPCEHTTWSPYKGRARYLDLVAGGRRAPAAAWTYPDPLPGSPDTRGHLSFDFHRMDAWFEEDERLHVHARDPYLRVDALRSSRHVQVLVGGELVADTRRPVVVCETGLVTRYYLPSADVRRDLLRRSERFTMCPYKGRARYCSVQVGDTLHEDAAWYYRSPLRAVAAVEGHLAFWNERDDTTIVVDGEPLPRLGLRPSGDGGELLRPSRLAFGVPAPARMRGTPAGGLQHDFAGPNGRAEGPPPDHLDMDVERAGGRPGDWFPGPGTEPPPRPASPRLGLGAQAVFTFTPTPPDRKEAPMAEVDPAAPARPGDGLLLEPSPRRVRVFLGGQPVADSCRMRLLHRPRALPAYAFPTDDVRHDLLEDSADDGDGPLRCWNVRVGDRVAPVAAYAYREAPEGIDDLPAHVFFDWNAMDAWYEEDDEVFKHARDPYHRVDVLHSSRDVRVAVDGVEVAHSTRPRLLFETGLPTRYYLPAVDVRLDLLLPTDTHSVCPYKGVASYWSVWIDGREHRDVVWSYPAPIAECPKVEALLCFFNERVDLVVDGVQLERPRTPWS